MFWFTPSVSAGEAVRECHEDGIWGNVDVLSCQSLEIVRVVEEVKFKYTITLACMLFANLYSVSHEPRKMYYAPLPSEQAMERLPGADEVIEDVTPELLESVAAVSEQLAMATDIAEGRGLLPLDLEATNDIVAQVTLQSNDSSSMHVSFFLSGIERL